MIFKSFKKPIILDPEVHRDIRTKLRTDMTPFVDVDMVPVGYSEMVACSMYYPVFFLPVENRLIPVAMVGMGNRCVFLKEDATWKVDIIPKALELYPFGVVKKEDDYLVVLDMSYADDEGIPLFDEEGAPTEFFSRVLQELTDFARDLKQAEEFTKEVFELELLESINLTVDNKYGVLNIQGMHILKPERLLSLQPEKMYALNSKGYLFTLHAHYLSLRNFKLFDLI